MTSSYRPALAAALGAFSTPTTWPGVSGYALNPTAAHLALNVETGRLYVGWDQNKRQWQVTFTRDCDWTRKFPTPERALAEAMAAAARLDRGQPAFAAGPGTADDPRTVHDSVPSIG